jgi:hypothetical protein
MGGSADAWERNPADELQAHNPPASSIVSKNARKTLHIEPPVV